MNASAIFKVTATTEPDPPKIGRPHRFDADTERRMILDAALRVMAQNGYGDASVNDVLAAAGLSTRAYYRHFQTKADLILTLLRRDAERVGQLLRQAVQQAAGPSQALDAWLDGFLDIFYDVRRTARTTLFTSQAVRSADGYDEAHAAAVDLMAQPLIDILTEGHRRQVLRSPDPEIDARSILAIGNNVCDPIRRHFTERAAARDHLVRFCWPALGLDPTPDAG